MKIFLITDINHGKNSNYPSLKGLEYINVYGEDYQKLIPILKREMDSCDLVINLGDFILAESEEKDREAYKEALNLLSTKTPIKHVAGNHDLRNLSRERWSLLAGEDSSYYSFDMGGYHHIVLNGNVTEPRGPYHISEKQLLWLEEDLKNTMHRTIVYAHHPLDKQSMDDNYYFKDKPERTSINNKYFVRRILEKSEKVLAVFSGHTHFYNKEEIEGILYFTVPSFLENNGKHAPKAEYGIALLERDRVTLSIKKVNVS